MIQADVCIIGGGPAGAAAALTLARYTKHRVVLVESSDYAAPRVGETVSAGIVPLLAYLGADSVLANEAALPAFGSAAAWGSDQVVERDFIYTGRGQGLHLDRRRFDQALAGATGGTLSTNTRTRAITRRDDGWTLRLDGPDGSDPLSVRVIVDATGRPARVARRLGAERRVTDQLIGLVCHLDLPDGPTTQTTLVETVPEGWWYTAPLPSGRAVAALMTDADLLRGFAIDGPEGFMAKLHTTRHVSARLSEARPRGHTRVFPAESHVLNPPCGTGWIAAGDAACAFDPLASLGIGYALTSGIQAARIADGWLRGDNSLALAYPGDIARHAATHAAQGRAVYATERRWPDAPFWRRRQA